MRKKRRILIFLSIILFLQCKCVYGESDNDEDLEIQMDFIDKQLDNLNIKELENVIRNVDEKTYNYFPKVDVKKFIQSILKGENIVETKNILNGIFVAFFKEVIENLNLLVQIIVIIIMSALLINLQGAFEQDSVSEIAYFICYIILATLVIKSFVIIIELGKNTINTMVGFMEIILPILLTLLVAIGGSTTKLLFNPVIIGTVNIISTSIKNIIFPLVFFSFIVGIISRMSHKIQFSRLAELLRQTVVVLISVFMTIFIGVMSIYGVGAKVDGVSIRTAKFAVDKFVPIVGKFLADAVETVVGCSAILKNAIGLVGLFSIFLICIMPIIKVVALIFIYKVAIVLIEPISDENVINFLDEVSKSLLLILVSILSVGTMFFITISMIIEAGNTTLMLR